MNAVIDESKQADEEFVRLLNRISWRAGNNDLRTFCEFARIAQRVSPDLIKSIEAGTVKVGGTFFDPTRN